MHAIKITEQNIDRIIEAIPELENKRINLSIMAKADATFYFVTGYVSNKGEYKDWTILPRYIVERGYQIDISRASTGWDQIVRKEFR